MFIVSVPFLTYPILFYIHVQLIILFVSTFYYRCLLLFIYIRFYFFHLRFLHLFTVSSHLYCIRSLFLSFFLFIIFLYLFRLISNFINVCSDLFHIFLHLLALYVVRFLHLFIILFPFKYVLSYFSRLLSISFCSYFY